MQALQFWKTVTLDRTDVLEDVLRGLTENDVAEVLGLRLPVARVEDVLHGKVWAALDPSRRASKRQKDLADIARLIEVRPALRSAVPQEILDRLI